MKIKNIGDLNKVITLSILPESVVIDVQGRIIDHIIHGRDIKHPYIHQQYRYVEKVIRRIKKKEFTRKTLNNLLEEIVEEYFSDETVECGYGLMDVVESVKAKYSEEIAALPS